MNQQGDNDLNSKLIIVMIGLPARGKSYITKKLIKYFNFLQYYCKVFNVGNTRRLNSSEEEHDSKFFDPSNRENASKREEWAMDTLNQLINWVTKSDNSIGIFDATNTTKLRRKQIVEKIRSRVPTIKILFLESICDDASIIEKNIKLKLSGPDYSKVDPIAATLDFKGRLKNYEKIYETIDTDDEALGIQYVKIINVGLKIISFNIEGFLASQTVFYLLNFKLNDKQIWLTRHGETLNDLLTSQHRLGNTDRNSSESSKLNKLTPLGLKYSKTLTKFISFQKKNFRLNQLNKSYINNVKPPLEPVFEVWTSIYSRSIETGKYFKDMKNFDTQHSKILNELSYGLFDNLTIEEFQNKYEREFNEREKDKLNFRFPGSNGESYMDVINRLKPIITDLERLGNNLLIISHKVIIRILLGYFMNFDKSLITDISIPLHCIYCLVPKPYGVDLEMYQYDEHLDWFYKVPEHKMMRRGSISNEPIHKSGFKISLERLNEDPFEESDSNSNSNSNSNTNSNTTSENVSDSEDQDNFEFKLDKMIENEFTFDDELMNKLKNLVLK